MVILLTTLFIILCLFLAIFIFIQQGKGDMGLGSIGGGSQVLFGGSGGQEFFVKATWILGALFIAGALGLSILKTHVKDSTRLKEFTTQVPLQESKQTPNQTQAAQQTEPIEEETKA